MSNKDTKPKYKGVEDMKFVADSTIGDNTEINHEAWGKEEGWGKEDSYPKLKRLVIGTKAKDKK